MSYYVTVTVGCFIIYQLYLLLIVSAVHSNMPCKYYIIILITAVACQEFTEGGGGAKIFELQKLMKICLFILKNLDIVPQLIFFCFAFFINSSGGQGSLAPADTRLITVFLHILLDDLDIRNNIGI